MDTILQLLRETVVANWPLMFGVAATLMALKTGFQMIGPGWKAIKSTGNSVKSLFKWTFSSPTKAAIRDLVRMIEYKNGVHATKELIKKDYRALLKFSSDDNPPF